ncbi:hypothetical protein HPB51_021536 [Rhipicephalus microplus]|uniref:Uncharacterized protein n=1 Tax=Rhipicephalus microplus TaxID=6941 RepID=A0A9J6EC06_RHIMP|nr:hypothetical protein HPB51_021536 [Rhipicephalus microplus]
MTKHYNLRDRERDNSEMNGDGAGNLQAFGVADSGTGGHGSVTSDTASEQQLELLQLQLKIAEAETEKQRLMLESQRLRARNGAESNESDDSVALGGRSEEDRRLKFASLLKGVLAPMPNQEALTPMWFEDVEATLESYEVASECGVARLAERFEESEKCKAAQKKANVEEWQKKAKTAVDTPMDGKGKKNDVLSVRVPTTLPGIAPIRAQVQGKALGQQDNKIVQWSRG